MSAGKAVGKPFGRARQVAAPGRLGARRMGPGGGAERRRAHRGTLHAAHAPQPGRTDEGVHVTWWLIPLVATTLAWAWTRMSATRGGRVRPRPEPGSPEDRRDLARFADALAQPLPQDRR